MSDSYDTNMNNVDGKLTIDISGFLEVLELTGSSINQRASQSQDSVFGGTLLHRNTKGERQI